MSLPLNQPTAFNVKAAELKKTLDNGAEVWKVGLELNGEKAWAEMFRPTPPPKADTQETLIVTDSEYGLKAKRPSKGGGGGGRPAADSASIEAQVALKEACAWGAMQYQEGKGPLLDIDQIKQLTKGFAEAIREAK